MIIQAYAIQEKAGKPERFSYERELRGHDVLVRITHCGIAAGDIQFINNDWGDTRYPLVPGHEIIGIIEETGAEVADLRKGDRVGIGYQQEACFECQYCKDGNEQFCRQQKVIAVDCYGGLAECIMVDGRFAFKLPQNLNSAKSVPLLSSGVTVYSAINKAELQSHSSVAVLGIGGLGHLALQFLNRMGHKVSAFSHAPEKKAMINELGAEYVNYSDVKVLAKYTREFDFILSTVNADFDLDTYLKLLKPQGKFCVVASPLKKTSISLGLLYDSAQRTIYGNYVGSRKDMRDMLAFSTKHSIEGMVQVMPFSKMNEAIELVKAGKSHKRLVLEAEHK